jgi:hypothetical protein
MCLTLTSLVRLERPVTRPRVRQAVGEAAADGVDRRRDDDRRIRRRFHRGCNRLVARGDNDVRLEKRQFLREGRQARRLASGEAGVEADILVLDVAQLPHAAQKPREVGVLIERGRLAARRKDADAPRLVRGLRARQLREQESRRACHQLPAPELEDHAQPLKRLPSFASFTSSGAGFHACPWYPF